MWKWRPNTPRGVGRGGISGDGISLVPDKPRIGVLVHSSHPLLTQVSAQLYSFRASGRRPKFPLSCKLSKIKQRVAGGACESLPSRPRKPPTASEGLPDPPTPPRAFELE